MSFKNEKIEVGDLRIGARFHELGRPGAIWKITSKNDTDVNAELNGETGPSSASVNKCRLDANKIVMSVG